jgi:hypothetical protein
MEVPKDTPCVAILNNQKCYFSSTSFVFQNWRTGGRNVSCLGELVLVCVGRVGREMVESEYGANMECTCM